MILAVSKILIHLTTKQCVYNRVFSAGTAALIVVYTQNSEMNRGECGSVVKFRLTITVYTKIYSNLIASLHFYYCNHHIILDAYFVE